MCKDKNDVCQDLIIFRALDMAANGVEERDAFILSRQRWEQIAGGGNG